MTRSYSQYSNSETEELLSQLANKATSYSAYREVMTKLGLHFGNIISEQFLKNSKASIHLACTVEDADYLANGILNILEARSDKVSFSCFWNKRFTPFDVKELRVSPILRQYQEPVSNNKVDYLVIVKSIISGACVVRTNLTNLIQTIHPEKIIIVAPVVYKGAEERLSSSFPHSISEKFDFFYFAEDDERSDDGIVIPGIGGDVYERLGFNNQDQKNKVTPSIVKERRRSILSAC